MRKLLEPEGQVDAKAIRAKRTLNPERFSELQIEGLYSQPISVVTCGVYEKSGTLLGSLLSGNPTVWGGGGGPV